MINGLEGIPGSGKSYEASVVHVLEALKRGRKVITNLPLDVDAYSVLVPEARDLLEVRTTTQPVLGTWDATRKEAFELFPDGKALPPPADKYMFGSVWDYYSPWKHPKEGFGPLFVIDECHVALSKEAGPGLREVVQWFKLSRHFNCDVLLMTQSFRDVNDSIRTLLAMLIKVRKADIIGKTGYIRKVHGGYRGAMISDETREYDPAKFCLYRSHTQGGAVNEFKATDVRPSIVKWRWAARIFMVVGVAVLAVIVAPLFMDKEPPKPKTITRVIKAPPDGTPPTFAAHHPVRVASSPSPKPAPAEPLDATTDGTDPEPYGPFGLHLTGMMQMSTRSIWTFTVSQNGFVTHAVTDAQLVKAGYKWRPMSECAGILEWQTKRRAITCNTPQVSMASPLAKGG